MTDLGNKANSSKIDRCFSCQFVFQQPKRFKKADQCLNYLIKMKDHFVINPYLSIFNFYQISIKLLYSLKLKRMLYFKM